MSTKTRAKLKKLFSNGRMPSQVDFSDLIDSSINPLDDGFNITIKDGIQVAPAEGDALASVYAEKGDLSSVKWRFKIGKNKNYLLLKNIDDTKKNIEANVDHEPKKTVLSISGNEQKIAINKEKPEYTLDVNGTVACKTRIGCYKVGVAEANGQWQDILMGLEGCHMFEVVAGVSGGERQGHYALVNALAMNCYNPDFFFSWFRKRIKHQHAWYFSRWDRIIFRWQKDGVDKYKLQVKTIRNYKMGKKNYQIKYQVTQLWVENLMRYDYDDLKE
jgi:hypothetical protein